MSIFIRTLPNVMQHFGCSADDARRFMDLREEGYGSEQAAVMAGLADPYEPDDSLCPDCEGDGRDKWNDYLLPCVTCGGMGRLS